MSWKLEQSNCNIERVLLCPILEAQFGEMWWWAVMLLSVMVAGADVGADREIELAVVCCRVQQGSSLSHVANV